MMLPVGEYTFGPDNAELLVRTGRQGAAAKAGHDLVLQVTRWEASLVIASEHAQSRLELIADATSLEVAAASGGMRPLTAADKADIVKTIDRDVLRRQTIRLRSTEISDTTDGLAVNARLTVRGTESPISFTIGSDGRTITGSARLDQRAWGIKPFSALLGRLRVDPSVVVELRTTAVLSSVAPARHEPAAAPPRPDRAEAGAPSPLAAAAGGEEPTPRDLGDRLLAQGDIDGAQAAYERAEACGDVEASARLAALLEDHRKDLDAAEAAWRRADDAGSINGAGNLGRLLKERGDLRGAEAAFRRCADRGGTRATIDYAGLVSLRANATPAEVEEAVAMLCPAIDGFVLDDDGMLMAAPFVLDGIQERCDARAVEAGLRLADTRGSSSGAYHHGFALWARGDRRAAAEAYHRSAQLGYGEAWAKATGAYLELGDLAAAEAVAREGDGAGAAVASTMLGMVLDQLGDVDGGLEAYRRADERGDGTGSFNLGIELIRRGDLRGAEAALQRAVERDADNAEAALAQVQARLAGEDPGTRSAGESRWSWGVRLELGGDVRGAVAAYAEARRAGEEPQEPRAILRYAEQLENDDDPRAEGTFVRIAEASEPDVRAGAWRAIARYRLDRGELDGALVALQTVVDTGDRTEAPRALRNLGTVLEDHLGDADGARRAYEAAIAWNHPRHSAAARVNLAQLLDRAGDHVGAASHFQEVIESGHAREAPRALVLFGIMLEEQGDKEQALRSWERAVELGDAEWSPRAALNAGSAYHDRGQFQRATALFRIACEHPEQEAVASYFLGLSEARQGNTQAAGAALRRAATVGSGEVRAEALRQLSELR